ncbi:MAG: preprotein translocase subunit SecE [Clostridia bacterium]|nr:preprotein translocase subunit SecE [Clostridia bacterium]
MVSKTAAKANNNNKADWKEKITKFAKGSWAELKKVHWPNRQELITYTIVVLSSVFVVSALLWIFDSIFSFLLRLIIQ